MYKVIFDMQELMPYKSIVEKKLTDKMKKVCDIAKRHNSEQTFYEEFPFICFKFEIMENALDFYIEIKNEVEYIDIDEEKEKNTNA